MKHTELSWQSKDGLALYAQEWRPEAPPRAVVCLVHGLGEHSGRYGHVAAALNQAGYALLAPDLRGHGRSAGQRGDAASLEALLDDIDLLLAEAEKRFPGRPQFLYGHSLGGILVLNYALRRKSRLSGVIATAPALLTALHRQPLKIALARVLGRLLPRMALPSGLEQAALSRDPEVVRAYREDPLVHDRSSLRLASALLWATRWTLGRCAEFELPLLLMHGSADRIAFPESSTEFARSVRYDCTLKIWEGLYHEVHNEPEKGQVLAFMVDWLNQHAPA